MNLIHKTRVSNFKLLNSSLFCLVTLNLLLLSSCKKDKKNDDITKAEFNKSILLENIANNVIIPRYDSLKFIVSNFNQQIQALSQPVSANDLIEAQISFKSAYQTWQLCSSFDFGPAESIALKGSINTYPCDTLVIKSNITSGSYNLGAASNLVAIGFPAVDYLLFHNNVNLLVDYFNDNAIGANRLQYLKDVVANANQQVELVANQWNSSYKTTFLAANGTDVGSSIGLMVNALNMDYEKYIRDGKVGIPLGVRSLGIPIPGKAEAIYSQHSLVLLKTSVTGLQNYINGNGSESGIGFDDYLDHLEAKHGSELLSNKINTQFSSVITKIDALQASIDVEVLNNQSKVQELYDEMQKLVVLLKLDLTSALSILITYQDNDGD